MKVSLQFQEEREEIALKNQVKFGADSEQYPRKPQKYSERNTNKRKNQNLKNHAVSGKTLQAQKEEY